ncbi:hypothetical protein HGRIS_001670 [Hohenbuehelia grisea]|uniref:Enoyl-CoA hydratase n=1 Tax=Hohenbuehelia grisea TaxID=104357 RepID=A0ABR3JI46_9AGAR
MKLSPPRTSEQIKVSFPAEHVLLITFSRPKSLNAMGAQMTRDMRDVLNWFDAEPSLWVIIVTGTGRAFCAGADLKAWNDEQQSGDSSEQERSATDIYGFGAISRRVSSGKPIIAAVNGLAMGGGVEMLTNCDIVVASEEAKFALPEVKRGVVAVAGGIPRLARTSGHQVSCRNLYAESPLNHTPMQLASELILTGKTISATEARDRFRL